MIGVQPRHQSPVAVSYETAEKVCSRHSDDDMTQESKITAAILGELIPELEYAAPVLLERSDRGDPLVGTTSPTDLGFETGSVDSVLLEFFKSLVPYVKTVMSWGVLVVVQGWLLSERESRHQYELVERLNALLDENAKLRQTVERVAALLARRDGAPVCTGDVVESIATATCRLGERDSVQAHV